MITQTNLPDLLSALGFHKKGSTYTKTVNAAIIEVNIAKEEIVYPAGIVINEKQTCNFSADENFVVLECVHRLLEKGYKPEHLELEPKWKVGHGASGGRADILVKDNAGRALLIIECKTAGGEFKKAWNKTLQDGDQLFSYAQQISETQFLCLYTSDFEADKVSFQSNLIAHRDNPNYLDDNPQFKGFKTATDVKGRFAVWRDTYKLDFRTQGLFETNIQPYHIGKDKYTVADLHEISASDQQKKYHEFATILRQHNVSGRENAFDKLVNLFLCKLVDEIENPQELKFYWKGVAYDTHFDLLDRLQQLYQKGMGKFLGESITYIDQSAVQNAMRFIRQNPDATQKAVWHLFMQQKFFTNNDFSLIDVHNEKLFYQNADVLLKILQMWQDIRLTNSVGNNQFLGDMFEGFLDQGVKQSEGQYFTPMPICRFIFMSLPLDSLIAKGGIPKAIDYACGAGHFLNELAIQIRPIIAKYRAGDQAEHLKAQHSNIYGIEKEYRLSKVAKVSAFMYGQQEINICYGDGLVQRHAAFPGIDNDSFDLLVANPPYSVRGFLETLPEEERKAYALSDMVDKLDTNNSIEAFFIERAKQLLKAGGIAAIILPSSILSNASGVYIKAREILLHYFDIVAIAEMGSGTFGKTGTNTVTLFLRRKSTAPDTATHYTERVAEWFKGCGNNKRKQVTYKDEYLIEKYAAHIGVPLADYKTLLAGDAAGSWKVADHFDIYLTAFNDSAEVNGLYKQKYFKLLAPAKQTEELERRFLNFVQSVERDKLYHFVMASDQSNAVLIVRSPTDNKEQKAFLGYEWSSAKGDEGIKLIKDSAGRHLTPLYDEADRDNAEKLNRCISANFDLALTAIPAALQGLARLAPLVEMIDFSRAVFEKQFNLAIKGGVKVVSKWPISSLGGLAEIKKGSAITQKTATPGPFKVVAGGMTHSYTHNASNRKANTITVSASGASAGFVAFWKEPIFASDCTTVRGKNDEHTEYLYYILKARESEIQAVSSGAAQPHVYPKDLEVIQVPTPDPATLRRIVSEFQIVGGDVEAALKKVGDAEAAIAHQIANAGNAGFQRKSLADICDIKRGRFSHRPRNDPKFFNGPYPFIQTGDVVRAKGSKVPYTQTLNEEGLAVSKLFQPPLVLVTIAANIGDTAVLDYPACFTDSVVGLIPKAGVEARFLELMMRAQKQHLNAIAPQMAQKNINIEILKPIKVPVPTLAEQKRIVAAVEKLEATIAEAQAVIDAAPSRKQAILESHL